jgi:hypothetical protein
MREQNIPSLQQVQRDTVRHRETALVEGRGRSNPSIEETVGTRGALFPKRGDAEASRRLFFLLQNAQDHESLGLVLTHVRLQGRTASRPLRLRFRGSHSVRPCHVVSTPEISRLLAILVTPNSRTASLVFRFETRL